MDLSVAARGASCGSYRISAMYHVYTRHNIPYVVIVFHIFSQLPRPHRSHVLGDEL